MATRTKSKDISSLERSNSQKNRLTKGRHQQSQPKIPIQLGGPTKIPESTLSLISKQEVSGLNKQ